MSAVAAAGLPSLEKYELIEEIGHGGMATVYRARDPRLSREVAVKIIHKHLRENSEVATRFVAEARAAAKLRHPGIVEVYDVSSEDSKERYLVVELVRGTTLRKILTDRAPLPPEIGAALVLELCDALEHAHEAGIIHRDIKPENVLVELPADRAAASGRPGGDRRGKGGEASASAGEGEERSPSDSGPTSAARSSKRTGHVTPDVVIKITDFGIAKMLDAQGVTSTGQVLGSPAHMAPEQIEGGEVDPRTDVFAVGVLFYECIVGHLPFRGKNPAQVLRRVLDGVYSPAEIERAEVGGRWSKILAGALERDLEARTRTPAALAEQIRAELEALGVTEPAAELAAYFRDPSAYTKKHTDRLVPLLVNRGEGAKKRGDVCSAALDFNRALALAPTDPTLLKRVRHLTTRASRRALLKRASTIAAGSLAIGGVAYAAVRVVSAGSEPDEVASPAVDAPVPSPTVFAQPPSPATSVAEAVPDPGEGLEPPKGRPKLRLPPQALPPKPRKVSLSVTPQAAILELDGTPRKPGIHELLPGSYALTASHACCEPLSTVLEVPPLGPDDGDEPLPRGFQLKPKPTTIRLVGGPAGGKMMCPNLGITLGVGQSSPPVEVSAADSFTNCVFSSDQGTQEATINLRAGAISNVSWPSS